MDVHVWTHYGPMLVVTWSSAGVWTQRSGAVDTSGLVWTQSWNLEVWTQRETQDCGHSSSSGCGHNNQETVTT